MRVSKIDFDLDNVKGHVIMKTLLGRERLSMLKQIKLTPDESGNLSFNDNTIDALINGTSLVEKHVQEISLIINDEAIATFEELEYSSAFNTVIMKLIGVLLNGPERLGNSPKS